MNTKITVLVIEDDEAIQALLETMLGMEGYRVLCAYDGLGGLSEVAVVRPDLIFLDMGLPIMDGEAFVAAFHQTPPPHAPIIGVSAYQIQPQAMVGLSAFLKKPFDLSQVRDVVNTVLRRYARV